MQLPLRVEKDETLGHGDNPVEQWILIDAGDDPIAVCLEESTAAELVAAVNGSSELLEAAKELLYAIHWYRRGGMRPEGCQQAEEKLQSIVNRQSPAPTERG